MTRLLATLVVLGALSGCGNDSDPRPTAQTTPGTTPPTAGVVDETQLASSDPVSMEGAASLKDDCNIEGVDGALFAAEGLTIQRNGIHEISGWIVDPRHREVPQDLTLIIAGVGNTVGVWTSRAPMWIERKGVAESRGYGPELNNSGFSFKIDTSLLPAGPYHVYVTASGTNGLVACDPGRTLRLSP